ncbi:MAG: hypothetical protein E6230_00395 [Paenibacillus dendritiformis]|uniref:hypothetical protein n=1 Tax=Paenibacillus dendritiformis TaxID=130049 RepID=UPI00143D4A36|nr:hypothetical protein [Paenibacillus dendritiformis]MDU5140626.1 hypothetical protein [Paenibacillus dendritiformis]NKI23200.1 hypothetical protein [Paenibacillus dendritiformis]NRG00841.1 hypothetical protein [Paenibacillus dendritiformis]
MIHNERRKVNQGKENASRNEIRLPHLSFWSMRYGHRRGGFDERGIAERQDDRKIPVTDLTEGENGSKDHATGRQRVIGISCGDLPQRHPDKETIALKEPSCKAIAGEAL